MSFHYRITHFPAVRTAVFLVTCAGVAAQSAPPHTEAFVLGDALAKALTQSPILQAYAFEPRMAEARVVQAGIRPNPELTFSVENLLGTGSSSGVKGLEATLQLSQIIDLSGHRVRRLDAAEGERALVSTDYELRRLDVLSEVARRFTEAVADAERLTAATRALSLGEQTLAAVTARVKAGGTSPMELNKAKTALATLQINEEHAGHKLAASRQRLAVALGESIPSFGPVTGNLLRLPAVPAFEALALRLEQSPTLARFAVEAKWREAQVRLVESLRRSGLQVSGGLRRLEATNDWGMVAGISIPLGVRDQQRGNLREARERRAQVDAASEATRLEMRASLFEVYQELIHARSALSKLQTEIIPTAEETLVLAEQGYRTGRFTLLDLLDAQKSLIELRSEVVATAAAFQLHVIEIERLLGGALEASVTQL